ncbi:MAG: DUF6364 family protein [Chitinophagales bacterium]|nr:DUF6364 family protein [Chitinophagales bacterium]
MNEKLTLSLNRTSIRNGKEFAKRNSKSVSALIQDYFDSLNEKTESVSARKKSKTPITDSIVKRIRKARKKAGKKIDSRNYKKILAEELTKKYNAI